MKKMNSKPTDLYWKALRGEPLTAAEQQVCAEWQAAHPEADALSVLDEALLAYGRYQREMEALLQSFPGPSESEPAPAPATDLGSNSQRAKWWHKQRPRWWSNWDYIAAAVLFLIACGAVWKWYPARRDTAPARSTGTVVITKEALTDQDRSVVLVLMDGSRVAVKDDQTGVIATQRTTAIKRLSSGELAYQGTNGGAAFEGLYNEVWAPKGKSQWLRLPDGSRLCLNGGSGVRFPLSFAGDVRRVGLLGEGYVEAAHVPQKPRWPFMVIAGDDSAVARGTRFSFRAYPDEAQKYFALEEGTVLLYHDGKRASVRAGQVVKISARYGMQLQPRPVYEMLAFKDGLFYFEHSPIEPILRELARWHKVKVVENALLHDPRHQHLPGTPRQLDLRAVLAKLENSSHLRFRFDGTAIEVIQ